MALFAIPESDTIHRVIASTAKPSAQPISRLSLLQPGTSFQAAQKSPTTRLIPHSDASTHMSGSWNVHGIRDLETDDRDAQGGGVHERNCRQDEGAELRSEVTQSEATNHKTTPTTCTSCLLISQVGVSYALFVL